MADDTRSMALPNRALLNQGAGHWPVQQQC